MKRKSIIDLLQKLEEAQVTNNGNISNLNDASSLKLMGGDYVSNDHCQSGFNPVCHNNYCGLDTRNGNCMNNMC